VTFFYVLFILNMMLLQDEKVKQQDEKYYCSCFVYLSGIKRDECVAPIPGRPCLTGLYVIENSPK
jgi:hypothetical protein